MKQKNDHEFWNGKETERFDVEKQRNIGHEIEIGKSDEEKRHEKVIDMEKRWEDLTWKKKDKLYMEKKKLKTWGRRDREIWYESKTGNFDM